MTANLAVVLLAAGESSRLGQSKQLVSIGGKSLVRRAAEILLQLTTHKQIKLLVSAAELDIGLNATESYPCTSG